jgi:hypothetical protein
VSILIRGYGCEQFGFALLPNTLEVVLGASSPDNYSMFTPVWADCKEGNKSTLRNYFKKIARLFLFQYLSNMSLDSHQERLRSCARPSSKALLCAHPIIPCFCLPSNIFPFMLDIKLGLPRPLVLGPTHCIFNQSLNPIGIHLFCCAHGGEEITSHEVVRNVFASIVKNVGFHVLREWTHILPLSSLQSSFG